MLFKARYEGADHDEVVLFREGSRARFGRSGSAAEGGAGDIVVWEEYLGRSLSRVAGELRCVEGQMQVRNLSLHHELHVGGEDGETIRLRPRLPGGRPMLCSLPAGPAWVAAPSVGPWRVLVWPVRAPRNVGAGPSPGEDGDSTITSVPDVPDGHRDTANALCAPRLAGSTVPATYAEVARALGLAGGPDAARRRVAALCAVYLGELEEGARQSAADSSPRVAERRAAQVAALLWERRKVPCPPDSEDKRDLRKFRNRRGGNRRPPSSEGGSTAGPGQPETGQGS